VARAWGTNLGLQNPSLLNLATDASCTAGAATTVLQYGSSPLLFTYAAGGFFLQCHATLALILGATPPTALTITLNLATAGLQDTYTVPPGLLTASAELLIPVTLFSANSGSIWYPTGDNPQIQVTPTGQAVTCKAVGTRSTVVLQQGV